MTKLNYSIKAAVIGDPISHSLSPIIHNFFLEKYSINGSYEAIQIKAENLKQEVEKLINLGFSGFNITIPHKEEFFKICHYKSKSAVLTGAVNTAIITSDKKIFGHNSDVEGFLNNLKKSQPNFNLKNKNVFVIGAGGAARAIVYGLLKSEVKKIIITNRNQTRAQNLIKNFDSIAFERKCEMDFYDTKNFSKTLSQCDLLINSTSLGMISQETLTLDIKNLPPSAIVYDIVYKPLMTNLLKSAESQGNKIITGIGMLIEQALVGFEAWFKKKPEYDKKLENLLTNFTKI
jgi:shikimate dehydrogenase